MLFKIRYLILPILVFLIALLVRLPLYHTEFMRTPDSIDYINVAENLAMGNGYIRTIKSHYFDEIPVFSSGFFIRPILTPIIYALLLKIVNDYYILQAYNLILGAVNVLLFYILLRSFISKKPAFLASLLIALNPNLIIENRFIISEQNFYFLTLLFFILHYQLADSKKKYVFLGIIAGLAYLTRVEGFLLLTAIFITNRKKLRSFAIAALGFLLTILPNYILSYLATGKPFLTMYGYHFVVHHFVEGALSFYHPYPTPMEFISKNYPAIMQLIANNSINYFNGLINMRFFGLLTLIPFLFVIKRYRPTRSAFIKTIPLLIFSLSLFAFVALTWSVFFVPSRHIALVYIFSVCMLFVLIKQRRLKQLLYGITAIMLCIYLVYDVHQLVWIRQSIGYFDATKNQPVYTWIRANTDKNAIIASRSQSELNLYTNRPSILIPTKLPKENNNPSVLDKYITQYDIKYFYVEGNDLQDYVTKKGKLLIKDDKSHAALYCVSKC